MIRIFVDANSLLRFYDSNLTHYKKLISSLNIFADFFCITSQVKDEVIRNRLNLAATTAKNTIKSFERVNQITLPAHFEIPSSNPNIPAHTEWEKSFSEFKEQHKKLSEALYEFYSTQLDLISKGTDAVSIALNKLFEKSIPPNTTQVGEAIHRKTLGNPPGKKGDPVGDELSWIIVRDLLQAEDELWLITNDHDYFQQLDGKGKCYLNPYLLMELNTKFGKSMDVLIFTDLSEAVRELQKKQGNKAISEKELEDAHNEVVTTPMTRMVYAEPPTSCPKCGMNNSLLTIGPQPSQFGGWSYWYLCRRCGFHMDSGEPYDD